MLPDNLDIVRPDSILEIDRKTLWIIATVLAATPFELRDEYWEYASIKVKALLNQGDGPHSPKLSG